jgi:Tol biopolymer transport system component
MSLERHSFEFEEFVLDADEKVLLCNEELVTITPKIFHLLLVLVENHGHIVEKEKLFDTVWSGSFVEDSNLTFSIRQLRKIFRDDARNPRYIETVPKRGYRFIADVKEISGDNVSPEGGNNERPASSEKKVLLNFWYSRSFLYSNLGVLTGIILLSAGFYFWRENSGDKVQLLTHTGSPLKFETVFTSTILGAAAISPDGRFVAYTNIVNGQQCLWLRQISSGIDKQVVDAIDGSRFLGVEFSPDSEKIYFVRKGSGEPPLLDRVSILGGSVETDVLGMRQVPNELQGWFSISPDHESISFVVRKDRQSSLMVAKPDGSQIRHLFVTQKGRGVTGNAFSPDGTLVAFASGQSDTGEKDFGVYLADVESGNIRYASSYRWYHVRGVVWFPDQSGLLISARSKINEPQQLWKVFLSNGEVRKITDLQSQFSSISASADLSQILLTQTMLSSFLYTAQVSAPDDLQHITQASSGVAWTPEDYLVYGSQSSGISNIWSLDVDRSQPKQLTTGPSADRIPAITPDGRYIIFVSDRNGKNNLWRMNADGSDFFQLTDGDGETAPSITPDGRYVLFSSIKAGYSLWRISVEGDELAPVSEKPVINVAVSPDGANYAFRETNDGTSKIVVKRFNDGVILHEFSITEGHISSRDVVWTRDGNALVYAVNDANLVGNLWLQALDGSPAQRLTNYSSEQIFYFDLSRDASQWALIRGSWNVDVVHVSGFIY